MFYGYKATLMRDLPFSALQFAFWEQFQKWAKASSGGGDIGIGLEILTGGAAGGLAGTITTPLDVVKTRIQTQVRTDAPSEALLSADIKPRAHDDEGALEGHFYWFTVDDAADQEWSDDFGNGKYFDGDEVDI
ncbi:hypothetical protein AA313_de0209388 [Arthrobotrys entomopaga]|nr:hypothetical protein AA313_de0209388 [Arthrobotrys entomopaga]